MPRPSTVLVIFVVALNVFALAMVGMGVDSTMGLDNQLNPSNDVPTDRNQDLDTGSGAGGTLFGMYNVLSQQAEGVFSAIFPAIEMFRRAGVPSELTSAFGGLMSFVIFFDVLSFIRGWDL